MKTMEKNEIKTRLANIARTNICDVVDEKLVFATFTALRMQAKVVCGTVYLENHPPMDIHNAARMLCNALSIPI